MTRRIIAALELPFRDRAGTDVIVGCSAGISAARGGEPVDELLRNADVAMYRAKADGKRRVEVFDPTMHSSIVERHALTADLGRSLSRGDLTVHYQPIVSLATGRIVGVEALVRWDHPTRGPIDPTEFIRAGRGEQHDPRPRAVRAPDGRPPGRGVASPPGPRRRWRCQRQPVAAPAPAPGLHRRGHRRDPRVGHRSRADLTLEMTETAMFRDAQATIVTLDALRAARRPDRDGRLRNRLLVARLPAPVPGRQPQDRPRAASAAPASRRTARPGRSPGRSSRSAARSACRSSPRASRPRSSSAMLRQLGCELGQGFLFGRPGSAER